MDIELGLLDLIILVIIVGAVFVIGFLLGIIKKWLRKETMKTEKKILYYLKTHCTGVDNAISARELSCIFGITERELRQTKRNIVLNMDARVGSDLNGYYYSQSDNEIMRFRASYLSRVRELMAMVKAYENEVAKRDQMTLIWGIKW